MVTHVDIPYTMVMTSHAVTTMDIAHTKKDQLDTVERREQMENLVKQELLESQEMMERMVNQVLLERRDKRVNLANQDLMEVHTTTTVPLKEQKDLLEPRVRKEMKDLKDHLDTLALKERLARIIMDMMGQMEKMVILESME